MQRSQVFKVKGMQRDLSMANTNGEFAYEILNMRLMPAEDLSGFSLTNEKGTTAVITGIKGHLIGQCPTNDSLVVFATSNGNDYIYEIYQNEEGEWENELLYSGNLKFSVDNHIEALFNYETEDIQKVYWIDGINQLRCINIVESPENWGMVYNESTNNWEAGNNINNCYFDSVKEINRLPSVEIERVVGGSFTAGVIQYYITYFNKNSSESPIVYTSPLLYIAHDNRGANVNDQVSTAFKLTFIDVDTDNWEYMRIYVTHRTSIDATPEASIVTELNMNNSTIEFIDYGSSRTSIAPTDLYFIGGKFVKAGTMTVKDQVMFLGHLNTETPETVSVVEIQHLFDSIRDNEDHPFTTTTRKTKENKLEEYEDTHYYYKNQLNNTESITHYKYGEKYRFGISVLDKYGNWSNPVWIKDAFIEVPPEQVDRNTLELPCPSLDLSYSLTYNNETKPLLEHLQNRGAISIKPIVVFPKEDERKVIAQGVVCPTVYNLKDRKENGPYAQSSWFMRPNAPVDLWNLTGSYKSWLNTTTAHLLVHNSDVIYPYSDTGYHVFDKSSILNPAISQHNVTDWRASRMSLVYDDVSLKYLMSNVRQGDIHNFVGSYISGYCNTAAIKTYDGNIFPIYVHNSDPEEGYGITTGDSKNVFYTDTKDGILRDIVTSGSWVEFRHNYALRTKGWSWGPTNDWYQWSFGVDDSGEWSNSDYPLNFKGRPISSSTGLAIAELYSTEYTLPPEGNMPTTANGAVFMHSYTVDKNWNRVLFYKFRMANNRCAEIETSRFTATIPVNRFIDSNAEGGIRRNTWRNVSLDKYNTGNSAYYVDNSIITLNSPDVELTENSKHAGLISNSNFRIIGMVPLTATISDISVETDGGSYNPSGLSETLGHRKVTVRNKNIGYHGYKGLVTSSLYSSFHNNPTHEYEYSQGGDDTNPQNPSSIKGMTDDPAYPEYYLSNTSLYPWQATGPIPGFSMEWEKRSEFSKLKKKILSNLRYSANSYYFGKNNIQLDQQRMSGLEYENAAFMSSLDANSCIGWKPRMGSQSWYYTSGKSGIIKLSNLGYPQELVYSADIDSIATATSGETNSTPITIYKYFYGRKLVPTKYSGTAYYTPYSGGAYFEDVHSTGIGTSIRYSSSSHIVTGFNLNELEDKNILVQEILPCLGVNKVGQRWSPAMSTIGQNELSQLTTLQLGQLYENESISSVPHQSTLPLNTSFTLGLPGYNAGSTNRPNYGWLWLGEVYRETDPTFGGTSDWALQNNQWETGGKSGYDMVIDTIQENLYYWNPTIYNEQHEMESTELEWCFGVITVSMKAGDLNYRIDIPAKSLQILNKHIQSDDISSVIQLPISAFAAWDEDNKFEASNIIVDTKIYKSENKYGIIFLNLSESYIGEVNITDIHYDDWFFVPSITWTQGDTYYQRFDTLKTYAYSDSDQNSVVDITSFMVETRINIDGRTDRNRGQESNLQMSPTNFNLLNDIYSQRDNFFTYRILDEDIQARTKFPNQITWSLTKTAGATVDAWMNITLASVLDLDGTKGELTALKNFNNNIIAFQEKGLSNIMFNSRAQIATSEAVPIQIANTGKVDGQQYFTTDIGCQDKWNIVTTPNGLYFVDYFNKSIYKFNGQLEDISTPNGFRSWCYKNLSPTANILGYYDVKNKEVMYYIGDTGFKLSQHYLDGEILKPIKPQWLGFSELTNAFSSFYTYPKAWFANVQDQGLWLLPGSGTTTKVYTHQTGDYNQLLNTSEPFYGLTVLPRQDSNIVKTFNNVEFRADSYNGSTLDNDHTFDTISAETEYQTRTTKPLTYNQYRPSNLKKKFRTWRANIPRVNNGYNRFVNQWAKIGLWKMNPSTEKTILHDLAVWYSE